MTHKPSDHILESVSALVDNEASEIELHRILKNISHDEELRERWRRYHIIGSIMRREHHSISAIDVSAAVTAAVAGEQAWGASAVAPEQHAYRAAGSSGQDGTTASSGWRGLMAKSGLAASFAASLILGVQYFSVDNQSDSVQLAGSAATPAPEQTLAAGAGQADSGVASFAPMGFELPLPESRNVSTNPAGPAARSHESELRALLPAGTHDLSDVRTQELLNRLLIEHAQRSSVNGNLGILPFARVFKMEEEIPQKSGAER